VPDGAAITAANLSGSPACTDAAWQGHAGVTPSRISFQRIASSSASKLASTMLGRDADRGPAMPLPVLAVDDDAGHGLGPAAGDAHAEIDQPHVVDAGLIGPQILGQRLATAR
jgi:hypothetical protein